MFSKVVAALTGIKTSLASSLNSPEINTPLVFRRAFEQILLNNDIMGSYEKQLYDEFEEILQSVLDEEKIADPKEIELFVRKLQESLLEYDMLIMDCRKFPVPKSLIMDVMEIRCSTYAYQLIKEVNLTIENELRKELKRHMPERSPKIFLSEDFNSLFLDSIKKYVRKVNDYIRKIIKMLIEENK